MKRNRVTWGSTEMEHEDANVEVEAHLNFNIQTPPRVGDHTRQLHVARVLQGMLQAFITSTDRDGIQREDIQTLLQFAENNLSIPEAPEHIQACENNTSLVAHDPNPWKNLPRELLPVIFVRLSLRAIGQLRSVSKEWNNNVVAKDSDFSQKLVKHHNMIARITPVQDWPHVVFWGTFVRR